MVTVTQVKSPNYSSRHGHEVARIVLHIMAGHLTGTDSVFLRSSSAASSHYGIGEDGTIHQYVAELNASWANGQNGDIDSITIEHAGGLEGIPCTDECVESSAQLCADIARRYGWTKLEHGSNVYLHREIPPYTHPNCPDICPNPLRWEEIITRANAILSGNTQNTTNRKAADPMFMIETTTPWGTTAYALIGEITGARALQNIEALSYANGLGSTGKVNWDMYNLLISQAWQRYNDFMTAMGKQVSETVEQATERIVNATKTQE